ncbi:ATP-dependent DNA helicase PIF1 [Apiospora arundinis]
MNSYRNAVIHLALFVPWEEFQNEAAHHIPGLWRSVEAGLGERTRAHVRNIALLRVSADDASADRRLQGLEEDVDDEWIEAYAPGEPGEGEDGGAPEMEWAEAQDYHDAVVAVLSAVRAGEIKNMAVGSALAYLEDELRAAASAGGRAEDGGDGGAGATARPRVLYDAAGRPRLAP